MTARSENRRDARYIRRRNAFMALTRVTPHAYRSMTYRRYRASKYGA